LLYNCLGPSRRASTNWSSRGKC